MSSIVVVRSSDLYRRHQKASFLIDFVIRLRVVLYTIIPYKIVVRAVWFLSVYVLLAIYIEPCALPMSIKLFWVYF